MYELHDCKLDMACKFFLIDTFYVSSCLTIDMHVVYHIKFLRKLTKGSYANLGAAFQLDTTYLKPLKTYHIFMSCQLCDVRLSVLPSFCIFTTY
jgi:hypothetical protein